MVPAVIPYGYPFQKSQRCFSCVRVGCNHLTTQFKCSFRKIAVSIFIQSSQVETGKDVEGLVVLLHSKQAFDVSQAVVMDRKVLKGHIQKEHDLINFWPQSCKHAGIILFIGKVIKVGFTISRPVKFKLFNVLSLQLS